MIKFYLMTKKIIKNCIKYMINNIYAYKNMDEQTLKLINGLKYEHDEVWIQDYL